MKRIIPLVVVVTLTLSSCLKDNIKEERRFTANVPTYMSLDDLRNAVKVEDAKSLQNPGKIFVYDNLLLVNEVGHGIHIIDNSNPSNPESISFLSIPGNIDLWVQDEKLFADSYIDLLMFNISDPSNPELLQRIENVFDQNKVLPAYNPEYPIAEMDWDKGVIIDFTVEEVYQVCKNEDCGYANYWLHFENFGSNRDFALSSSTVSGSSGKGTETGVAKAGSMSRFMVHNNQLYVIDSWSTIKAFEVNNDGFNLGNTVNIGWNIETLFGYDHYLFVGAQSGMYIYDLTNTSNPTYVSEFIHANSCDPVVVANNTAYVTLRGGNECNGFTNELNVIDVSNINTPELIQTYDLDGPYGLGIDPLKSLLFVCDGAKGIKVFDVDQNQKVVYDQTLAGYNTYDVITLSGLLILSAEDGIYQFSYADPSNISELSRIPIAVR